uniref:Galectin n=1 Tax=Panagrolaimus superbus TaxID=310955 RepID=A0A914YFY8_9BILA
MTAIKRKYASEEIYPLSMEWIINKDNLNVASPFMQIPNLPEITYSLSLNPNAGKKEDQAILCFHLKSDKNADIIVNAVISCKSAVFEHEWIYTFKKGETNTYNARICFSDELLDSDSEFFINNQMIIELKGTLKVEIVTEVESKITKYESLGLILWKSEGDKDVVIVVGDNELKVCLY